jgi:hypothetical protein
MVLKIPQKVLKNQYRLFSGGLAVNLPRPSYQSNKDETYFRARLALMIKPTLSAMSTRKKALMDLVREGMLSTLAYQSNKRTLSILTRLKSECQNITLEDSHVWIPINMVTLPNVIMRHQQNGRLGSGIARVLYYPKEHHD